MIKVAISPSGYVIKDYTEESFPKSMLRQYDYQEIELEDKYRDCTIDDFDLIGGIYTFNVESYNFNKAKRDEEMYSYKVVQKIRLKYSLDSELAILRQKADKPNEYQEYYLYCEKCKQEVKTELGLK